MRTGTFMNERSDGRWRDTRSPDYGERAVAALGETCADRLLTGREH